MIGNIKMKAQIKNFLLINLGALLLSTGVYFFKIPNGFSTGGVSGIATVLSPILGFLSPATLILIINVILLLIGLLFLGKEFIAKTAYGSLAFSLETWLFERLLPVKSPLTDQPLLELIYAVLLTAVGSAILFNNSASSGGTDIVAMILKKYTSINVGIALLLTDFLIAFSSFFVFNTKVGLFSMLGLFMKAFLVDGAIENINLCKFFTIVTDKPDELCSFIMNDLDHSVTKIDAIGSYLNTEKKVLLTVCRRSEGIRLKHKIEEIDPNSFIMVTNTSEIIGKGFHGV